MKAANRQTDRHGPHTVREEGGTTGTGSSTPAAAAQHPRAAARGPDWEAVKALYPDLLTGTALEDAERPVTKTRQSSGRKPSRAKGRRRKRKATESEEKADRDP